MARDAISRSTDLEHEVEQRRAQMQALEQQLLALGHTPCTSLDEQGAPSGGAARRQDPGGGTGAKDKAAPRASGVPKIPRLKEGGGATAEAVSAAAAAAAAAAKAPSESLIGKLARLSVPTLKRRKDGMWAEGEEGCAAKRLRTSSGPTGTGS